MSTLPRRRAPLRSVLLVAFVLASCGGGDSDGAKTAATGEESSAATAAAPTSATTTTGGNAPSTDPPTTPPTTAPPTTVAPTEPLVAGVDLIAVQAPARDAGPTPEFAWQPVDGAADYRLVVRGPQGPIWAWQGADTSVWLGGFSVEPPSGATELAIVEETCWSVVARDADGSVLAASALLPVTPTGEPGHTCDP